MPSYCFDATPVLIAVSSKQISSTEYILRLRRHGQIPWSYYSVQKSPLNFALINRWPIHQLIKMHENNWNWKAIDWRMANGVLRSSICFPIYLSYYYARPHNNVIYLCAAALSNICFRRPKKPSAEPATLEQTIQIHRGRAGFGLLLSLTKSNKYLVHNSLLTRE